MNAAPRCEAQIILNEEESEECDATPAPWLVFVHGRGSKVQGEAHFCEAHRPKHARVHEEVLCFLCDEVEPCGNKSEHRAEAMGLV